MEKKLPQAVNFARYFLFRILLIFLSVFAKLCNISLQKYAACRSKFCKKDYEYAAVEQIYLSKAIKQECFLRLELSFQNIHEGKHTKVYGKLPHALNIGLNFIYMYVIHTTFT